MRVLRTTTIGVAIVAALAASSLSASAAQSQTAPGVTATTIKVAYPNIDWEKLKASGVSSVDRGDDDKIIKALVDDINARGGVNGRKLDATVLKYDVLKPASAEATCVSMTEDSKVFAVLNAFSGQLTSVNTCVTDHKTVLVGGLPDPTVAAKEAWIGRDASDARASELLVKLLNAKGILKGKTIGISTDPANEQVTNTVLVPALKKAGHPAKVVVVNDAPAGDTAASDANWQVFAQKFKSAGVNHVILMGNEVGIGFPRLITNGLKVAVSTPNEKVLTSIGNGIGGTPSDYDGAYTLSSSTLSEAFKSPAVQPCIKAFKKENPGITVKDPVDVPKGDPDWATGITWACNQLDLFTQVAAKAGKNLTNESFRKAAQSMTATFVSGSNPYNTFGPIKFDANNGFRLAVFDHTIGQYGGLKPVGALVNLGAA